MSMSKSGMNQAQSSQFAQWLASSDMGTAIDTNSNGQLGPLELGSELGRRLCATAHRDYLPNLPLFFVPIDHPKSNAYACWLGSFDVVAITARLMREVETLSLRTASYILAVGQKGTDETQRSSFAQLFAQAPFSEKHLDGLAGLLSQGILAFLVGHEVGHLVAGHRGTFEKYQWSKSAVGMGCINEANQAPRDEYIAKVLNAHEIDADIQGLQFLLEHWSLVCHNSKRSDGISIDQEVAAKIFHTLLANNLDRVFMSVLVVSMALALLGFQDYQKGSLLRPTHPLTAVRMLAAAKLLPLMLGTQSTYTELIQRQCVEAISVVHSVLGSILLDSLALGENFQAAHELKATPVEGRLDVMLDLTGISPAIRDFESFGMYFKELACAFEDTAHLRTSHRRWTIERIHSWTDKN